MRSQKEMGGVRRWGKELDFTEAGITVGGGGRQRMSTDGGTSCGRYGKENKER